jgi:hypothetical protein
MMGSHGAWCNQQDCLNWVDRDQGWGEYNRCTRCRGYYCQTHMYYDGNAQHTKYCPDCLEAVTQKRIAADAR